MDNWPKTRKTRSEERATRWDHRRALKQLAVSRKQISLPFPTQGEGYTQPSQIQHFSPGIPVIIGVANDSQTWRLKTAV